MNCIIHTDRNAVGTCARCGGGVCNNCAAGSIFKSDKDQPYCLNCNHELALENDHIFKIGLIKKMIIMCIYGAAVVAGVIYFIYLRFATEHTSITDNIADICSMLTIWAIGSIASLFDRDSQIRRLLAYIFNGLKNSLSSPSIMHFVGYIIGLFLGTILAVLITGAFSPYILICCLIGINKVKKQISENNEILSRFFEGRNTNSKPKTVYSPYVPTLDDEKITDAEEQINLAVKYYNGEGVQQDYAKAVYWITRAAEQGHAAAQNSLGLCYYNGEGVQQDYAKAANWYMKAAEQGYAAAQYNLGTNYYHGDGVPQDYDKAIDWFTKAAEQGYTQAQCDLGICYCNGEGVPQDYKQGIYWYASAAEQGHAQAQCDLGVCYSKGEGVPQDHEKAVYCFTKAAEQGHAQAQCYLGLCYDNGEGVPQDREKAIYWYTKAAEQGYANAQNNLGTCYINGDGVPQDYDKAVDWFTKAAEQGNAEAQNNLKQLRK